MQPNTNKINGTNEFNPEDFTYSSSEKINYKTLSKYIDTIN